MKFKLIYVVDVEKGECESEQESAEYILQDNKQNIIDSLNLDEEDFVSCYVEKE